MNLYILLDISYRITLFSNHLYRLIFLIQFKIEFTQNILNMMWI